jgi:hypothetical protein
MARTTHILVIKIIILLLLKLHTSVIRLLITHTVYGTGIGGTQPIHSFII